MEQSSVRRGFTHIFNSVEDAYRNEIDDRLEDCVLVGYNLITEWVAPNGDRLLQDHHITAGGDEFQPHWDAKGRLRDALDNYDRVRGRS